MGGPGNWIPGSTQINVADLVTASRRRPTGADRAGERSVQHRYRRMR
jgi:hypothetical protein